MILIYSWYHRAQFSPFLQRHFYIKTPCIYKYTLKSVFQATHAPPAVKFQLARALTSSYRYINTHTCMHINNNMNNGQQRE